MDERRRALAARVLMASLRRADAARLGAPAARATGSASVCLFGSNIESPRRSSRALTDAIHAAGSDALAVIALDEEGGDVTRLYYAGRAARIAGQRRARRVDDVELTRAVAARRSAPSSRAAGVDLDLAPVADVNSQPRQPGDRRAQLRRRPAARRAARRGVRRGHAGRRRRRLRQALPRSRRHRRRLAPRPADRDGRRWTSCGARELVPFAAARAGRGGAVMTSHVAAAGAGPGRGRRRSAGRVLDLLRRDLGFDGLLVSDALDMAGASGGRGIPAAAVLALAAGVDLLCLGADNGRVAASTRWSPPIVEAVRSGDLRRGRLVDAAERVVACSRRVRSGVAPRWRGCPLRRSTASSPGHR